MGTEYLIGWRKFETEFNGEKVSMEIRPFRRKAMTLLTPFLEKWAEFKEDAVPDMQLVDEFLEICAKILPDHVRAIDYRVRDSEGEEPRPITVDDLTELIEFFGLTSSIVTGIATISGLNSGEQKNLGGPSGSMAEQAGTAQ